MGRARRVSFDGGIYHVMNRGVNRQAVFFSDTDRREFGCRLTELHELFGVETLAYCLMTNHYHLVIRVGEASLSDAMHHLGSVYTRHTNDRVGRDGPLFRGRFKSIHVDTDSYLRWVVRYVHRNALDLPGVSSLADYRWSSMRTHLGLRPAPSFVGTELVMGCFGGVEEFSAYHDSPDDVEADDDDVLAQLVEHAIAIDDLEHGDDAVAPQGLARSVHLLLAVNQPESSLADCVLRSIPSAQARSAALYRARKRAERDARLRRIVARVERLLAT